MNPVMQSPKKEGKEWLVVCLTSYQHYVESAEPYHYQNPLSFSGLSHAVQKALAKLRAYT